MRVLRRGRWQRCKISFAESSAEVDDEYDESYEKEDAYDYADDGSCGYPVVVVVIAIWRKHRAVTVVVAALMVAILTIRGAIHAHDVIKL